MYIHGFSWHAGPKWLQNLDGLGSGAQIGVTDHRTSNVQSSSTFRREMRCRLVLEEKVRGNFLMSAGLSEP